MTLAVLCSGQGTQHAGMFELTAQVAAALPVFEAASGLLGGDPRQWVSTASQSQLYANQTAQLLCCTQALAAWAALDLSAPIRTPDPTASQKGARAFTGKQQSRTAPSVQ